MFEDEKNILKIAIEKMDIPEMRRNLENINNIRWMQSNLGIRNSEHRHFEQAMSVIKTILKDENK